MFIKLLILKCGIVAGASAQPTLLWDYVLPTEIICQRSQDKLDCKENRQTGLIEYSLRKENRQFEYPFKYESTEAENLTIVLDTDFGNFSYASKNSQSEKRCQGKILSEGRIASRTVFNDCVDSALEQNPEKKCLKRAQVAMKNKLVESQFLNFSSELLKCDLNKISGCKFPTSKNIPSFEKWKDLPKLKNIAHFEYLSCLETQIDKSGSFDILSCVK